MALVIKTLYKTYDYYINVKKGGDFVDEYFLCSSPIPTVCILGLYWYFVKNWGPKYMTGRPPYNLQKFIIVYNLFQVIANLFMFVTAIYTIFAYNYGVLCSLTDYSNTPKARAGFVLYWLYFLLKILDLLDTVFFVLRKKFNQVTVLHFYHHFLMVVVSYAATRYLSGGQVYMIGVINSFVHAIMYSYYLITCLKTDLKHSLWWKKHITHIQLIQFIVLFMHALYPLVVGNCPYPKGLLLFALTQHLTMLILFSNFYYRTYIQKKSKS